MLVPWQAAALQSSQIGGRSAPARPQEGRQAAHNFIVARFGPSAILLDDAGVVHLVDGHDQLGHAQGLGQLRMLARLAPTLKAGLKLALRNQVANWLCGFCRPANDSYARVHALMLL